MATITVGSRKLVGCFDDGSQREWTVPRQDHEGILESFGDDLRADLEAGRTIHTMNGTYWLEGDGSMKPEAVRAYRDELASTKAYPDKPWTIADLRAAFATLHNPTDWRAPIDTCIRTADLELMQAAVRFVTATRLTVKLHVGNGWLRVVADGYRKKRIGVSVEVPSEEGEESHVCAFGN